MTFINYASQAVSFGFYWYQCKNSLALIRITAPGIGMLRRYSHGCLINYHESFALFGRQLNLAKQYHCTHFEVLKLLWIHTHISWSSTNGSPAFVSLRDAPWAGTVTSSHITYKVRNMVEKQGMASRQGTVHILPIPASIN